MSKVKDHQIYELVNDTFKDITLCLGGIFLTHKVREKVIWEIANSIEDIYYKTMGRLEDTFGSGIMPDLESNKKEIHLHPAIEGLLKIINFKPASRKCR
ncbi:hypothetical protein J7L48_08135 [bacterium]|nr:hypothetical protein [bacterium]